MFDCTCNTQNSLLLQSDTLYIIKHALWLISVHYFGQFFYFPVHRCFSGFAVSLSSNTVLYTTNLCIFLKRSIQPSEARKPGRAATCKAFSFRWGPSMDALAVRACLNHAEMKVSSSYSGEVFRDLGSLENDGPKRE